MSLSSKFQSNDDRSFPWHRLIINASTGEAKLESGTPLLRVASTQCLVFIHHGMTTARREGRVQGRLDTDLDEEANPTSDILPVLGDLLGCAVPQKRITIYSSPAKRAYDTAQAIGRHLHQHGLKASAGVTTDRRLLDMSQGSWEGMLKTELANEALWRRFGSGRDFLVKPSGLSSDGSTPESLLDVLVRTYPFFHEISQQPKSIIVVVGHKMSTVAPGLIFYCPSVLTNQEGILNWRQDNLYSMDHLIKQNEVITYGSQGKKYKRVLLGRTEA